MAPTESVLRALDLQNENSRLLAEIARLRALRLAANAEREDMHSAMESLRATVSGKTAENAALRMKEEAARREGDELRRRLKAKESEVEALRLRLSELEMELDSDSELEIAPSLVEKTRSLRRREWGSPPMASQSVSLWAGAQSAKSSTMRLSGSERVDHLKAVKKQLVDLERGRKLLSQSKTAATPSQTPKRRKGADRGPKSAMLGVAMLSPFDSNSSLLDRVDDVDSINLSPLIKGKSVDILRSKAAEDRRSPSPISIGRKFSSFDGDDTEDDLIGDRRPRKLTHSPSSRPRPHPHRHRKMTHSPRRRDHLVEPAAPFFRRHSNSFSIQKQRPQRLKDRTRSFHQSAAHKLSGDEMGRHELRHSLPPNTTSLRQRHTVHSIQTQSASKQSASRSPQPSPRRLRPRPSAVTKRRSFHFVSTRSPQQSTGRLLK